eukprot:3938830-Prorocentrum_lima.AAC.1
MGQVQMHNNAHMSIGSHTCSVSPLGGLGIPTQGNPFFHLGLKSMSLGGFAINILFSKSGSISRHRT